MTTPDCTACRLGTITVSCPTHGRDGSVCAKCAGKGKRLHRHTIVWGEGPAPNEVMLLGEAPGHYEDLTGRPFRPNAPAGRVLHRALAELGMQPFTDNIVKCRPPNNRLKDYPDAIDACIRTWLDIVLSEVRPKVIVTLGVLAASTWFPGLSAHQLAETARATTIGKHRVVLVGALHPSYIARGTDPTAWHSLLRSLVRARELAKEIR